MPTATLVLRLDIAYMLDSVTQFVSFFLFSEDEKERKCTYVA